MPACFRPRSCCKASSSGARARSARCGRAPCGSSSHSAPCCGANGASPMPGWKARSSPAGLDDSGRVAWPVPSWVRPGGRLDRAARDPGRPRHPRRRHERLARGARQAGFQGRHALAGGAGEGRGLLRRRRPALSLSAEHDHITKDGGMKVRLAVDPTDRPLTAEADITVWTDAAKPRFDGSIQFARPVGRAPTGADRSSSIPGASAVASRVTALLRIRADRIPVRPGRSGDQAQGQRQPDVRSAAAAPAVR